MLITFPSLVIQLIVPVLILLLCVLLLIILMMITLLETIRERDQVSDDGFAPRYYSQLVTAPTQDKCGHFKLQSIKIMESDFSKCVPALGAIKRGGLVKKKLRCKSRLAVGAAWAVAGRFRGRVWRRGVERGPGSYGRGQRDGRGHVGHGEKDGMGQEKEDGMDGEMALHAIPTIGDNHDQHGH